ALLPASRRIVRKDSTKTARSAATRVQVRGLDVDRPLSLIMVASFFRSSELLAHLEHSGHPQRAVELAREGQRPRGGKGDVYLHLALRRDVLVDAERGNGDVVQGADLVLDDQRQLLARIAPEEGGPEVVVVGLQLELR